MCIRTGLATGAIALGEVAALNHELGDDAVEAGPFVAEALLARGQSPEVLNRLGDCLSIETNDNATSGLITNGDVEENLVGDLWALDRIHALREQEHADAEEQRSGQQKPPEVKHDD